jgi:dTDP-4-dehydrorhamnose 3,5-epimerase
VTYHLSVAACSFSSSTPQITSRHSRVGGPVNVALTLLIDSVDRMMPNKAAAEWSFNSMEIISRAIAPVLLLKPKRFTDMRGYFTELYNRRAAEARGLAFEFIQDNMSFSSDPGTVRGLHFQASPSQQTKLVSVLAGAILDVVVDLRVGSTTYGEHVAAELSADNGLQMLAPRGFAHGFCTLTSDTLVLYKVDGLYDPERDFGLRWNDPALGIHWPIREKDAKISPKDRDQPLFADLPHYFSYPDGQP